MFQRNLMTLVFFGMSLLTNTIAFAEPNEGDHYLTIVSVECKTEVGIKRVQPIEEQNPDELCVEGSLHSMMFVVERGLGAQPTSNEHSLPQYRQNITDGGQD